MPDRVGDSRGKTVNHLKWPAVSIHCSISTGNHHAYIFIAMEKGKNQHAINYGDITIVAGLTALPEYRLTQVLSKKKKKQSHQARVEGLGISL